MRGRDVGLSFHCWRRKKPGDQRKWDHNGAHRNSRLKPKNMEHVLGGFRHGLHNKGETVRHLGEGEEEKGGG